MKIPKIYSKRFEVILYIMYYCSKLNSMENSSPGKFAALDTILQRQMMSAKNKRIQRSPSEVNYKATL